MSEAIPTVVWSGEIDIAGLKLKMYVLDDGRRIIDADSLATFLEALGPELSDDGQSEGGNQ